MEGIILLYGDLSSDKMLQENQQQHARQDTAAMPTLAVCCWPYMQEIADHLPAVSNSASTAASLPWQMRRIPGLDPGGISGGLGGSNGSSSSSAASIPWRLRQVDAVEPPPAAAAAAAAGSSRSGSSADPPDAVVVLAGGGRVRVGALGTVPVSEVADLQVRLVTAHGGGSLNEWKGFQA